MWFVNLLLMKVLQNEMYMFTEVELILSVQFIVNICPSQQLLKSQ